MYITPTLEAGPEVALGKSWKKKFKKIAKAPKKVFKKIAKAPKKVFKAVGKVHKAAFKAVQRGTTYAIKGAVAPWKLQQRILKGAGKMFKKGPKGPEEEAAPEEVTPTEEVPPTEEAAPEGEETPEYPQEYPTAEAPPQYVPEETAPEEALPPEAEPGEIPEEAQASEVTPGVPEEIPPAEGEEMAPPPEETQQESAEEPPLTDVTDEAAQSVMSILGLGLYAPLLGLGAYRRGGPARRRIKPFGRRAPKGLPMGPRFKTRKQFMARPVRPEWQFGLGKVDTKALKEKALMWKEKGEEYQKKMPAWLLPALGGAVKFIGKPGVTLAAPIGKKKRG